MNSIFHVDVNSAFLSWTAVKKLKEDPDGIDLRLIPSAVGGDVSKRRGVITACSLPAKKLGVKTGEPVAQALEKCPELIVVPSDFAIYKEYSEKFVNILRKYSPVIEQTSIDEAYMDMSESENPVKTAEDIKEEIKESLGFTVNIGISNVKILSKMASDFEKPDKIHTLYAEEIEEKMWQLPIERLHGCGRMTAKKLRNVGIKTIGEAAGFDKALLISLLGEKQGEYIHESSNGIGGERVKGEREAAKSYSNETTLELDITKSNYSRIMPSVIKKLSEKVSRRMKKDGVSGFTIVASLKSSSFSRRSKQTTLSVATNDADTINTVAAELVKELSFGERGIIAEGEGIRLVGVGCSQLDSREFRQLDIFSYVKEVEKDVILKKEAAAKKEKEDRLQSMVDKIEKKYGKGKIKKLKQEDIK